MFITIVLKLRWHKVSKGIQTNNGIPIRFIRWSKDIGKYNIINIIMHIRI